MKSFNLFQIFLLFSFICFIRSNLIEKYRPIREKCQRTPNDPECLQIKKKFLQLLEKCQSIQTEEQFTLCKGVKEKFCAIFTSICTKTPTTKRTTSKKKLISSIISTKKPNSIVTRTTTTTGGSVASSSSSNRRENISDEEFIQVPIDPTLLRERGEYCIRHGKEKKCQELLTNLKNTYSSCSKKNSSSTTEKPLQLDCHSFRTHLCKAFPKFPPCLKKN